MQSSNPYLHFDGNCRDAMTFYGKCLGATPFFSAYSEGPPEIAQMAKAAPERILHSEFSSGPFTLMGSDFPAGHAFHQGNNFAIHLNCENEAELQKLFAAFGEGGKVLMPIEDAFWGGRFGLLSDRFGVSWMFSYRAPR